MTDITTLVPFFLPGEKTPIARALYSKDAEWFVPTLWRYELRNVLTTYMKHRSLSPANAGMVWELAEEHLVEKEQNPDGHDVLRLAFESGCTAYDCEYVALAQLLEIPFITYDGQVLQRFSEVAMTPEQFLEQYP